MKFHKSWLVVGFALVLSGCFGSDVSEDGANPVEDDPSLPFLEATIEYSGPHERWAGPQNFSVKVVTWNSGNAQVTVNPPIQKQVRTLSNAPKSGLKLEAARADFARLNAALQADSERFHGCLLPVRVKLVRADGALIERQACRTQPGWARVAHEIANHWIEIAVASPSSNQSPKAGK